MSEHIVGRTTYTLVFVALMALLVLSVVAASLPLGDWNVGIALAISVAKTLLILLFFMHIYYAPGLTRLVAVGGLLWLAILLALVMADYQTREWRVLSPPAHQAVQPP